MCSYNQVNNSYGCQNSKLINGILKDEMMFQGFVMSDWAAQHSGVASVCSPIIISRFLKITLGRPWQVST